jgi:hypothetical protein
MRPKESLEACPPFVAREADVFFEIGPLAAPKHVESEHHAARQSGSAARR